MGSSSSSSISSSTIMTKTRKNNQNSFSHSLIVLLSSLLIIIILHGCCCYSLSSSSSAQQHHHLLSLRSGGSSSSTSASSLLSATLSTGVITTSNKTNKKKIVRTALSSTTATSSSSSNNESNNGNNNRDVSLGNKAASIFGLIKSMLGTGVLALPGALSVMSNYKSTLVPANILLVILGILSTYTFILYGRLVDTTKSNSLGELWNIIYSSTSTTKGGNDSTSSSNSNSNIVSIASFALTFGIAIAYSLIIGDIITGLVAHIGSTSSVLSTVPIIKFLSLRQLCVLGITLSTLYPLCNLQSLKSLAPFSILGVIGSLLTTAFITWRCPIINPLSPYNNKVNDIASFNTYNRINSPSPLVLVATACVSLSAHFGVCDFYNSLKGNSSTSNNNNNKKGDNGGDKFVMKQFISNSIIGFAAVALANSITMVSGFLTFGGKSAGIILNNYYPTDIYATISKLLVAISVIGAYPIVMSACKSELLSILNNDKLSSKKVSNGLLCIVTAIALLVEDAGFVISFIGAVLGCNIVYTFPSLLFLKQTSTTKNTTNNNNNTNNNQLQFERLFCKFIVGFGILSSIIGGATTIISSFFPHLLGG